MAMIGGFIHILLRLPFGAASSPSKLCISFKMAIDLAMDILDSELDPASTPTPNRHLISPPKQLSKTKHFPNALPLDVDIPYRPHGPIDGYIDDMWTITVDEEQHLDKANKAIDMAIQLTF